MPYIPHDAVGCVTPENAADFIKAGAVSIGIGNHLLNRERVLAGAYDEIRDTAVAFCACVQR